MISNLIVSGGIFHDFEATSGALSGLLHEVGIQSRITTHVEDGLATLQSQPVRMLTINALRWEMAGEKYDHYREQEALTLSEDSQQAIAGHLRKGGALLALHTASICFSNWPEWSAILGGAWQWGRSWHPTPGPVRVTPSAQGHVRGLQAFEVTDELYTDLVVQPSAQVLLRGEATEVEGEQPVLWAHTWDRGRVVYDALGHDVSSLNEPNHRQALLRAVNWALAPQQQAEGKGVIDHDQR